MTTPLRVAFIGAGGNTRARHLPGFQALPEVELVAVCNRSLASSQQVAEDFGIARIEHDVEALLNASDVDAICIGTWPDTHAHLTIEALKAGKHVLVEARMAANLQEARQMVAMARKHPDLVAQIVPSPFTLKYDATIARLIATGELGDLREIEITHTLGANVDPQAPLTFRHETARSGVNMLMLGIWHEALQRWMAEEPASVRATGAIFTPQRTAPDSGKAREVDVPDTLTVLGATPGGTRLVYRMSGLDNGPPRQEVRIFGSKAGLHLDVAADKLWKLAHGDRQTVAISAAEARDWAVEAEFVASIREGKPVVRTSLDQGLRYMAFTEAAWQSWQRDGAAVPVANA